MGRRRSSATKGFPPNLYERGGYFAWRDPRTGKEFGLGRDRRSAITQAIEANHEVEGTRGRRSLIDRITVGKTITVGEWCTRYEEILGERKLRPESRRIFASRLRAIRTAWEDMRIDAIDTREVASFIDQWERAGKKSMAKAMRSFVIDMFKEAQAKGWVKDNPASPTRAPAVEVNRSRLTLEAFLAIHAEALKMSAPWVARGMELALVTGQRREDVATMGPKNVRDGRLWVVQAKTNTRVSIPLDLRLNVVGWSIEDVIGRCRDNVLSKHFLHHSRSISGAKAGEAVAPASLTSAFAKARDNTGLTWDDGKKPPSFHEIRSLAARLYAEQGVNAKSLLGHKSAATAALYQDVRGAEWIEVKTA